MVWDDDVDKAVKKTGKTDLHKPNPYPLLRASESYKPYQMVLYVGDTIADKIMARKANNIEPKFLFAGVYGSASLPEEAKELFIEEKSDIVTPSVNELPLILEEIKDE
jgi:phosphoglycolate phosphatase-like HAD superfamily hydrolase